MKRMVVWLISMACLGTPGAMAAYGNMIKGCVTDHSSGARLTGATIILNEQQQFANTDQLGNFRFDGLEDGKYAIKVTFIGYESYTAYFDLSGGETTLLSIALQPSTLCLDEVVISSGYSPEETMTTINKIDTNLRPFKSSQDVLQMIPGVVTAQHAGGGKAEQIFLRGFDIDHGTDIALSVDGMAVNMVSHAHGQGYADLHFVIPELIEYVDFNKGPYYSNTGDFNTAGYARFHTKNHIDQSSIKFEAGRFNNFRTVAMLDLIANSVEDHSAFVSAEYLYNDGPFESRQKLNRLNLFGKYHGVIGTHHLLNVSLSTFKSQWNGSGQIPERAVKSGLISRFGSIDDTEGGSTGRDNINLALTKLYDDGSSFRNQIYFSRYDFDLYSNFTYFLYDPVNGDQIRQKEKRNIYGYSGTFQKEFGSTNPLRFEGGIALRYDDVSEIELSHVRTRNTFLNSIASGDVDQFNGSIYSDVSISINEKLIVNAGLRFDAFSFQYTNKLQDSFAGSAESQTILSPKVNVYYNFNSAFQAYFKNGIGFHSNDSRVVVEKRGENILPRAYGTDLGFYWKPSKRVLVNAALWHLTMEQEFVFVGDEAIVEPSVKTRRYGTDLSVRYQALEWLFIDFDGNYSRGRYPGHPDGKNYIPLAPGLTTIGGVTVNLRNGIRGSIRYRYIDDRPANETNSVTAYGHFLLDAGLTYSRPRFQINANASNLLNSEWNEAQFDTETRLSDEADGISELAFTPGDPFFCRIGVTIYF